MIHTFGKITSITSIQNTDSPFEIFRQIVRSMPTVVTSNQPHHSGNVIKQNVDV